MRSGRMLMCWGLAVGVAAGCGGPSAYQRVFQKGEHQANARTFETDFDTTWLAVNRAVLELNFGIDKQDKPAGSLLASRYFQDRRRTTTIVLNVSLQPEHQQATRVYVNATQASERVFARSHTRFFLWLIPLPGGGGTEANRVKEGERTLEDAQFYRSFFEQVEKQLTMLR